MVGKELMKKSVFSQYYIILELKIFPHKNISFNYV